MVLNQVQQNPMSQRVKQHPLRQSQYQATSGSGNFASNFKRPERVPPSYHAVMDAFHPGENFNAYIHRLRQYFKVCKCPAYEQDALFITVVGTKSHQK